MVHRGRVEDARQVFGAGQARNRTARAVCTTIPFTLTCQTLAIIWYATAGHDPADVAEHRARVPWYATKTEPSTADMAAKPPPRPDRRQISATSPWPADTRRNQRHPPGLGNPSRISEKVERQQQRRNHDGVHVEDPRDIRQRRWRKAVLQHRERDVDHPQVQDDKD